jgi:hypothetical protein
MFIQFRHVEANEIFYHVPSLLGVQYKKKNHSRGQIIGSNGVPYKGRVAYRHFKPCDVVLVTWKKTKETAWMDACDHKIVPFDNDKQCVNCGDIGRKA